MASVLGHSWTAAAIVFIVVASTDWFDGRLARRWNVSSRLGSFLDTTADKLLITGVLWRSWPSIAPRRGWRC